LTSRRRRRPRPSLGCGAKERRRRRRRRRRRKKKKEELLKEVRIASLLNCVYLDNTRKITNQNMN
jgi:hypothetical protein